METFKKHSTVWLPPLTSKTISDKRTVSLISKRRSTPSRLFFFFNSLVSLPTSVWINWLQQWTEAGKQYWAETLPRWEREDPTHSDATCDLMRSIGRKSHSVSTRKSKLRDSDRLYLSFLVSDSSAVLGSSSSGTGGNWDGLSLSPLLLLSFLDFW